MARLLLLRHGQSSWNAEGRWQGWADPPLSPLGEEQAEAAALRLADAGLTAVVSSDLARARQTAAVIADRLALPLLPDEPDLRERDIGDWSALTTIEIEQGWPGWLAAWRAGELERPPNGETRAQIAARVMVVLERLAAMDGTVLVVTHGGVIHAVQDRLGCERVRMGNLCGQWVEPGLRPGDTVLVPTPAPAPVLGCEVVAMATTSQAGTPVRVVRSAKRRKTVSAREVDGVVHVSIPARMTKADEAKWVDEMVRRIERQTASTGVDLDERAALLAKRYRLPVPQSIRWVSNQGSRWGSCTPADGTVRISDRLADCPTWVLDYVLVHELAHLVEPSHDRRFHELADRYPKAERARGFLMAKGLGG